MFPNKSMAIQWYPGHMTSALRVLAESIPKHDVVIEVLDARVARASANPVLGELLKQKPCLEVLAKSDLADPAVTSAWLRYFESHSRGGKVAAIATTMQPATRARVLDACRRLVNRPSTSSKNVRVIIVGIPNAGKSTLINTLTGRKVAKVGDEPAVTKGVQKVVLDGGIILSDNPGILWPKMDDEAMSLRLALSGAVPDTVIDYEIVGLFAAGLFLQRYPSLVKARYDLDPMPREAHELLLEIGRRRGCVRSGGVIDLHKAADVLVHDFRTGALGRISLDEPA
jgi:ribosome biogenesis GTPase A